MKKHNINNNFENFLNNQKDTFCKYKCPLNNSKIDCSICGDEIRCNSCNEKTNESICEHCILPVFINEIRDILIIV